LLLLVLVAFPLALGRFVAGCAAQGDGQRCSVLNNSDDCQTGLVCTSSAVLGGSSDICCLPSGDTLPACIPGGLGVGGAGSTTVGAGGFGGGGSTSVGMGGMGGATTTTTSSTTTSSTTTSSTTTSSSTTSSSTTSSSTTSSSTSSGGDTDAGDAG
jgi:hypothetical protein